jgi:hypothetical protein
MKGASNIKPDPEIEIANNNPDDYSTNQEATVLPWFVGEQKIAVRWISPVYEQETKAVAARPGKK